MHKSKYIGRSLWEIAAWADVNHKGYVVFLLQSTDDDTGRRIDQGNYLHHILERHPELAECVVQYTEDYYGQRIFRVRESNDG